MTWKGWIIRTTTWKGWITPAITWIRAETRHDRVHHPLVGRQSVPGADARRSGGGLGRHLDAAHAAGRDSGPVRRSGDRQDQLSGPGAAGGRGPGDLPADHRAAGRPRR